MNGHSPLHIACERAHLHIVEQLLRLRADPLIQGKFRCNGTPLHTAARIGNKILVSFLLDWGVDVNTRDRNNNSILHLSCQLRHYELARYLIEERRADFQARNLKDTLALDLIPVKDAVVKDKLLLLCARMKVIYEKEEALRIARIEREKRDSKEREERERQMEREGQLQVQLQRQQTEDFRARMATLCCHARDVVALTDLLQGCVDQDINMPLDPLTRRTALHICTQDNNLELVELLLRCAGLDINAQVKLMPIPIPISISILIPYICRMRLETLRCTMPRRTTIEIWWRCYWAGKEGR
ncbi:ankyrin repeat domain-containing protein, partial [archaeon]